MTDTPLDRRLKIMLVHPGPEPAPGESNLPVGLLALAAALREDHDVKVRDWIYERWTDETLIAELVNDGYDIVGFTSMTWQVLRAYEIINAIKKAKPDLPVIMGGVHPTSMPQEVFDMSGTDFICAGEGEETFTELLHAHFSGNDVTRVEGLWLKDENGKAFSTGQRALLDVQELPEPARDMAPIPRTLEDGKVNPLIHDMGALMFSRGCWSDCDFCASPSFWRRKVRIRSVDQMIDELKGIIEEYGIMSFRIQDDIFTSRKKSLLEFCERVKPLKITYTCLARSDQMTEEKLLALRSSGCVLVSYGVESGNQEILKKENKKQDLDQVRAVFAMHHKFKVPVCALIIVGHVGETVQSLEDTYNIIKEIRPTWTLPQFMCPYPGSALHYEKIAENTGTISTTDYNDYVNMDYPIYIPKDLTPELMLEWREKIRSLNPENPMKIAEEWVSTYLHKEL